ncbi:MAG: hypothetical protein ACI8QG_001811, partial [Flavobacteriales bacterium]
MSLSINDITKRYHIDFHTNKTSASCLVSNQTDILCHKTVDEKKLDQHNTRHFGDGVISGYIAQLVRA